MQLIFDFCLPVKSTSVPDGPDWLHEIKFDGYRLRVERNGDRVRLITKGGYDWSKRFPWICRGRAEEPTEVFRYRWDSFASSLPV
jgi:ATP-dependent DNA ligase